MALLLAQPQHQRFSMAQEIAVTKLLAGGPGRVWIKKVVNSWLRLLGEKRSVSVVLVGNAKIKKLNREYRGKDKVTDVLSFGDLGEKDFLGEIVICLPQIRRQAKKYQVAEQEELARMLAHGLLHLKGLDHECSVKKAKKMFQEQERLLRYWKK